MISEAEVVAALPPAPSFFRDYIIWGMWASDLPAVFHVPAALSLLAPLAPLTMGVRFAHRLKFPVLYNLIVGPSGIRKTHAILFAKDLALDCGAEFVCPIAGSAERLADRFREEPRQWLIWPEFGKFLAESAPGKSQAKQRDLLTALHDCDPSAIERDLVDRTPEGKKASLVKSTPPSPRCNILAGCTPPHLSQHTSKESDWQNGNMSRFLVFRPYLPGGEQERDWDDPEESARELSAAQFGAPVDVLSLRNALVIWYSRLLATSFYPCGGVTTEAKQWLRTWKKAGQLRASDNPALAGSYRRITPLAYQVAMVLAMDVGEARTKPGWLIGETEMRTTTAVLDMHLKSLSVTAQGLASNDFERLRAQLLNRLLEGPAEWHELLRAVQPMRIERRVREVLKTCISARELHQAGGRDGNARWHHGWRDDCPLCRGAEEAAPPQGAQTFLAEVD